MQFKKTANLIQTDMNQFSMLKFSEKWLSKINFFQNLQKKIRKKNFFRKKNIEKKISKKISKKIFFQKNFLNNIMCGKKYFILQDF